MSVLEGGPVSRDRSVVGWLLRKLDAAGCKETADRLRAGDAARRMTDGLEELEHCCKGAPVWLCLGKVHRDPAGHWQYTYLVNSRGVGVTEPELLSRAMVQNLSYYAYLVGIKVVREVRKRG